MKIGFTGTRRDITARQYEELEKLLNRIVMEEFHHGDCVGADATAHSIMMRSKTLIVIHPPTKSEARAYCTGQNIIILPAREYLSRNKDIVNATEMLIACPAGPEVLRSGTWSTVRYAEKNKKEQVILWPNGNMSIKRKER